PRRHIPRRHRPGVVRAHLQARPDYRDQSLRDDLLPARRAPRLSRHHRAQHALPVLPPRVERGPPARSRRACGDGLLVLALRRRGVGGGLHRGVRGGAMTPADRARPSSPDRQSLELPAPTASPMVLALGITLICSGLVTNAVVSVIGFLLAVAGGVGWWRQVLPVEHVEVIPLRPLSERAAPVV